MKSEWHASSQMKMLRLPVVLELRAFGHDVLTVAEFGKANQEWPDVEVFKEAVAQGRVLVTKNRRHYYKLHRAFSFHYGIVACTDDPKFDRAAANIHKGIHGQELQGRFVRVNKQS
jgi:hypothetical protein